VEKLVSVSNLILFGGNTVPTINIMIIEQTHVYLLL